jgi:hypothetical protein
MRRSINKTTDLLQLEEQALHKKRFPAEQNLSGRSSTEPSSSDESDHQETIARGWVNSYLERNPAGGLFATIHVKHPHITNPADITKPGGRFE